jgi:hypothetical protein
MKTRDRGATVLEADADYEDCVRCVVMPCCGFTFSAGHTDDRVLPAQYTCPLCESGGSTDATKPLTGEAGECP